METKQKLTGSALQRRGRARKIVVVGAGLAGLSAAYELAQAGHEVTILEARTRPGGRVYTLRAPFSDNLYAEAGALAIADVDSLTLGYVKGLELSLDSISPRFGAARFHLRGRWINPADAHPDWPVDLTPEEQKLGSSGIWEKYVASVLPELGNLAAAEWPPVAARGYDQLSLLEFLGRRGASDGAAVLLECGILGLIFDSFESVSALAALLWAAHYRKTTDWLTIRGGNDLLPKAFAAQLAERIFYGSPVVAVEQNTRGVRVVVRRGGIRCTVDADYMICTVPLSVLGRIDWSPPLSREKQRAMRAVPYTSVARVYLQSRRRFWTAENVTATAFTDLSIGPWIEEPTFHQPGPRGIIEAHMVGATARYLTAMAEGNRVSYALKEVARAYPAIRDEYEGGMSKCWNDDEWSAGAYSYFKPGQVTSLLPFLGKPEGRVYFAGEHTSRLFASMEGALESGTRVAREINDAAEA